MNDEYRPINSDRDYNPNGLMDDELETPERMKKWNKIKEKLEIK